MEPMGVYAEFYDLEYGDFLDDLAMYVGFAARTGGPILELGCGTGRLLVPLAKEGYEVTGVDISAKMLERAREKAIAAGVSEKVELIEGDVRTFSAAREYPLAISAVSSFMALDSLEKQISGLVNVRRAMRPGGILILDLFNPNPSILLKGDGRVIFDGEWELDDGSTVQKYVVRTTYAHSQVHEILYLYDVLKPDGRIERHRVPVRLKYIYEPEGRLMLEKAGYGVEEVYGSYELEPFDDYSPSLIFVARAK